MKTEGNHNIMTVKITFKEFISKKYAGSPSKARRHNSTRGILNQHISLVLSYILLIYTLYWLYFQTCITEDTQMYNVSVLDSR